MGMSTSSACGGGDGGEGGHGGGGGGGRGGHSSPVVFVGMAPMIDGMTTLTKGGAGMGGTGIGNGIDAGNDGVTGTACSVMDFSGTDEVCTVP
jgi:hypothetical protein